MPVILRYGISFRFVKISRQLAHIIGYAKKCAGCAGYMLVLQFLAWKLHNTKGIKTA